MLLVEIKEYGKWSHIFRDLRGEYSMDIAFGILFLCAEANVYISA